MIAATLQGREDPWPWGLTGLGHSFQRSDGSETVVGWWWGFLASCKSAKMLSETREVELIKDNWEGRRKLTFIEF